MIDKNYANGQVRGDISLSNCGPDDIIVSLHHMLPEMDSGQGTLGYVYETGKNATCVDIGARVFVRDVPMSPYVRVHTAKLEDHLFLLPDTLSMEAAALIEPFAAGTHGKNMTRTKPEDHVVIYGANLLGLCTLRCLLAWGNRNVILLGTGDHQLRSVWEMGGIGYNPAWGNTRAFLVKHFGENHERYPTVNVDVFMDCGGMSQAVEDFLNFAKPGAKLICLGNPNRSAQANFMQMMEAERIVMGAHDDTGYTKDDIREAIAILADLHPAHCRRFNMFLTAVSQDS